jgi:tetratricopeptide (TPR) repeat protein
MWDRVVEADRLSREGRDEEALELLRGVLDGDPDDAAANFSYARILDGIGCEREAIGHYERAMGAGLSGEDLEEATINLGSSYRVVGEYERAVGVWREGLRRFPENRALRVFLCMGLYNLGEHRGAMGLLLRALAETSSDPWVGRYARAIAFYSDRLDDTRPG